MSGGLSQTITPLLLGLTTGGTTTYAPKPTIYMALLTVNPSASTTEGTWTEVTTAAYGSYARVNVSTQMAASTIISTNASATNSGGAITFAVSSATTGAPTVTGYALVDNSSGTGGSIVYWGTFSSSMTVNIGNQPSIPPSSLTVTLSTSGGMSNYLARALVDHSTGVTQFNGGSTITLYAALTTTSPTASTPGTEASYTGYARVALTPQGTYWSTAALSGSTGQTQNAATITFGQNTGGGQTIVGVELFDASSSGNMIYWGTITSQTISTNTTPYFNVSGLTLQLT